MSTLFPKNLSVIVRTGEWVKGIWKDTETLSHFIGSIQPATGKDTEFLPQGRRDKGSVKVYSNTPMNVSQEGTDNSGDIVIWQGRKWEIVTALNFQNDLIPHYKYLATDIGRASE